MIPQITFTLNTRELERSLTDFERNQLPFATSLALNRIASAVQLGVQDSIDRRLTPAPSKLPFLKRLVRIDRADRSTKAKLETAVRIGNFQGMGGKSGDRSFLLTSHEQGEARRWKGARPKAIPTDEIRGGDRALAPTWAYPKNLRLEPRRHAGGESLGATGRVTRRGVLQLQGKRRTFVLDPSTMRGVKTWGVYQRTGPGPRDIRLLWAYRTEVTVPPRLRFYETALGVAESKGPALLEEALAHAIATAR